MDGGEVSSSDGEGAGAARVALDDEELSRMSRSQAEAAGVLGRWARLKEKELGLHDEGDHGGGRRSASSESRRPSEERSHGPESVAGSDEEGHDPGEHVGEFLRQLTHEEANEGGYKAEWFALLNKEAMKALYSDARDQRGDGQWRRLEVEARCRHDGSRGAFGRKHGEWKSKI